MKRDNFSNFVVLALVVVGAVPNLAAGQETPADANKETSQSSADAPANAGADPNAADQAKAAFTKKLDEYKTAIHEIEELRTQYQSVDEAGRKKINEQLAAQVAHAQSLVNAMVEAGAEAYRFAPNADPQITDLLISVARYNVIGRQIGPGQPDPRNPQDVYHPIDGGDQYERGLPIVKLLIDGGADDKQLSVLGFLCAFMNNDYDLATKYLEKAKESGAFEEILAGAAKKDSQETQAGLMQVVTHTATSCAEILDEYREYWAKESSLRAAEATADDLPRVKFTTSKGEVTIELFENEAPQTVANFLSLVKQGFFNGSPFHRVLPEFMAQGGAKDEDGQGGPGYTIRCECYRPDYRRHFRGTLSMAHAGRDTGNSQFFITFVPTPHLNGKHTAFGRVIEGIEVLGDLQRRSPQHQSSPPPSDRILKAEVIRDRGHEYKFDKLPDR